MLNLTLKNTRWTGALSIDKNAAATDPKELSMSRSMKDPPGRSPATALSRRLKTTAPF